jgi:hypothetical protein
MAQTVSVGCKLPHGLHLDINGNRVTLLGSNSSLVIGGHGITENVDKEFFDNWLSLHKDSAAVKNGLIFAHDKTSNVKAEAQEKKKNRNGFEGLDPAKPAPNIEPTDETKKELAKAGA